MRWVIFMGVAWAFSFAVVVAIMVAAARRDRRLQRSADPLAIDPEVSRLMADMNTVLRARSAHPAKRQTR